MATHGKNAELFGNGYDLTTYCRTAGASGERATAPDEAFGDSWHGYDGGISSGQITFGGLYSDATGEIARRLESMLGTSTGVYILCPDGDAVGNDCVAMKGTLVKDGLNDPQDDMVDYSAEVTSNVGADIGRVLASNATAQTTNGANNGASIDNGASSASGGVGYVINTAVSGTFTNTKVQHSTDDAAWSDLITFTALTANSEERVVVSGTVNRYLRSHSTLGGSSSVSQIKTFTRFNA